MKHDYRNIGVVGVGMVGGALARYFQADPKHKVFLYDKYQRKGSPQEVNKADVVFVCVPTPFDPKKHEFDVSYVRSAFSMLKGSKIVVIKSTVIPGTTEKLQKTYPHHKVLFNPEFLTEATADHDMFCPDRQIVGYTKQSYAVAKDILQLLPLAPFERIIPAPEAEMVKYFSNTWFGVKVSFANEMYDVCKALGLEYDHIMECAAADKSVGRTHLEVWHKGYRGYGGKCLPKDMKAFIRFAKKHKVPLPVHEAAEQLNEKLRRMQGITDKQSSS